MLQNNAASAIVRYNEYLFMGFGGIDDGSGRNW
jgi:hypothetical protein